MHISELVHLFAVLWWLSARAHGCMFNSVVMRSTPEGKVVGLLPPLLCTAAEVTSKSGSIVICGGDWDNPFFQLFPATCQDRGQTTTLMAGVWYFVKHHLQMWFLHTHPRPCTFYWCIKDFTKPVAAPQTLGPKHHFNAEILHEWAQQKRQRNKQTSICLNSR